MKKSYRIDEVAEEFDVSRRTIERLIQRGELQSFKVGDTRRIDPEEIERLKKRYQQNPLATN
jgi:excisionase family DNA binding protein